MRWWQPDRYTAGATLEGISELRQSARSIQRALSIVAALALMMLLLALLVLLVVLPARLASRFTMALAAVGLPPLVVFVDFALVLAPTAVVNVVIVVDTLVAAGAVGLVAFDRISTACSDEEDESHNGRQQEELTPTSPLLLRARHRSRRSVDQLGTGITGTV